jgi:CxxC motif-containing protein
MTADSSQPITVVHFVCINCPQGCILEVEEDARGSIVEVRGWSCSTGEKYARRQHALYADDIPSTNHHDQD